MIIWTALDLMCDLVLWPVVLVVGVIEFVADSFFPMEIQ